MALIRGLQRCNLFTLKYILKSWLTMFSTPENQSIICQVVKIEKGFSFIILPHLFVTSSADLLSSVHVRKQLMMCSEAFSSVSP